MRNKLFTKKHLLWVLPFFVVIIGSICFLYLYFNQPTYQLNTYEFQESTEVIDNPYMGWYRIYAYTIDDKTSFQPDSVAQSVSYDSDSRLALIELNIKAYRDGSISPSGLEEISSILDAWSQTNKQMILRVLYDWDGKASETEPSDIAIVQEHMAQLGPIINDYSDSIYLLQGIFIGNYAEMHGSPFMTDSSMTTLIHTLASVTDSSIYLAVRTPAHWRIINETYAPLSDSDAFNDSLASRISLFNDGMLGSGNDLGTYGDTPATEAETYGYKGLREDEIDFQNQLCTYVPNGGEVVLDNSFNDFENAILDLRNMHVSYLNYDYDASVLDKWKNTTYTNHDIYQNMNGYDYITCHMGYRYVIENLQLKESTQWFQPSTLVLSMKNTGFANYYMPCDMTILLTEQSTGKQYRCELSKDIRTITSGCSCNITVPLASTLNEGVYQLSLECIDTTTSEVLTMANTTKNQLGTLTISKGIR